MNLIWGDHNPDNSYFYYYYYYYWLRAMVYESTDHGSDVTCLAVPVVLFLLFCKKQINSNFVWKGDWKRYHRNRWRYIPFLSQRVRMFNEDSRSEIECYLWVHDKYHGIPSENVFHYKFLFPRILILEVQFNKLPVYICSIQETPVDTLSSTRKKVEENRLWLHDNNYHYCYIYIQNAVVHFLYTCTRRNIL